LEFGATQVPAMTNPSLEALRTPKPIRRSDPELCQVPLTLRGEQRITEVGRDTSLRPYDLVVHDSSRPFHGRVPIADTVAGTVAQAPRALFPLPAAKVDQLLAEGIVALLAQFLVRLTKDADRRPSDGVRLGIVLLDLVVALLAHELDADSPVPAEDHRRTLILRIQEFIRERPGDSQLTPAAIAAAHHISTRHLHRLFQDQGITVNAWIRAQRLESCRGDLADPALRRTPIHEIAMRRGFRHPAAFSRAFRGAYGLSPRDYRQQALAGEAARRQPPGRPVATR
jgi:AraC-like DNA-binding protein